MLRTLLIPALLTLASCASVPQQGGAPTAAAGAPGAVSSADPRATEAGLQMLRAGGTATDAALATMVALTVVEPQSSGIGGGGFLVHHDERRGRVTTYDGRETAPMGVTSALFLGPDGQPRPRNDAVPGGQSVGVPGNIRLMEMAHERHGRLRWAQLFEPAIRLARDGFVITPRLAELLVNTRDLAALSPWGRRTFFDEQGRPKTAGTRVANPELAAFLEQLAARGPDHFYTGASAEALARTVRESARNPSVMTTGDLASYDAKERPVVCGSYRGHRICGMGPPSSGGTTVFAILKQLERFDLRSMGPDSPQAWHLIAESMRLAYADRDAYLADPDFVSVPVAGLIDPGYLSTRGAMIAPDRRMAEVRAGTPRGARRVTAAVSGEVPSTSHFVATDRAGNVASYTSTIEGVWGSGLTVNGFYLNNELTDFSFAPEQNGAPVANRVEPGKRPRSSMAPTIVYGPDGKVRLAVGAAGGPTIIAQVAKAIIGVVDWNLSAQDAIALPQIVAIENSVRMEETPRSAPIIADLRRRGHQVTVASPRTFKANAVERVAGRWVGAADPRSEGVGRTE